MFRKRDSIAIGFHPPFVFCSNVAQSPDLDATHCTLRAE